MTPKFVSHLQESLHRECVLLGRTTQTFANLKCDWRVWCLQQLQNFANGVEGLEAYVCQLNCDRAKTGMRLARKVFATFIKKNCNMVKRRWKGMLTAAEKVPRKFD